MALTRTGATPWMSNGGSADHRQAMSQVLWQPHQHLTGHETVFAWRRLCRGRG